LEHNLRLTDSRESVYNNIPKREAWQAIDLRGGAKVTLRQAAIIDGLPVSPYALLRSWQRRIN